MQAVKIANQEADEQFKWAAYKDARMRSVIAETTYGQKQKIAATRMQHALELCYNCKAVHVNFRKTFIAVKVDQPNGVVDKKSLKLLEQDWEKAGYGKRISEQGITYKIPKV